MKIGVANLCVDCNEIVENDRRYCPSCLSSKFLPVEYLTDPPKRRDRENVINHWAKRKSA